jgi:hypothetical protein
MAMKQALLLLSTSRWVSRLKELSENLRFLYQVLVIHGAICQSRMVFLEFGLVELESQSVSARYQYFIPALPFVLVLCGLLMVNREDCEPFITEISGCTS